MKNKQIIAAVTSSALGSVMAHGAQPYLYSGPVNYALPYTAGPPESPSFDVNGDGVGDFLIGFDQLFGNTNSQKPYIQGFPNDIPGSTILAGTDQDNLPVATFDTVIGPDYLEATTNSTGEAYFDQEDDDGSAHYVGSWPTGADTEGYVGMALWDGNGNTNYAWVRIIFNSTGSTPTLTVVDYAYNPTPFVPIYAGLTNPPDGSPNIYDFEPPSQTAGAGGVAQFSVTAAGAPTLTYQWQVGPVSGNGPYTPLSNGGVISGATNATLTINGVTAANQGDYRVVISNSFGSATSTNAVLTVVSPAATPTPQVLFGGLTADFNVNVSASLSPSFQWQKNGTNLASGGRIAGAQSGLLQISNLQLSDAAIYDAVVTLSSQSVTVTSTPAMLTVLPVYQESIYDAAVLADKPVAYYRLAETGNPTNGDLLAYDNAGGFNGIYGIDVTNAIDGITGPDPTNGYPGFASNSAAAFISPNDTNSWITLAPWNMNTNAATFTAWVNPAALPNEQAGIVFTGTTNGTYAGLNYYFEYTFDSTGNTNIQLAYTWNEGDGNDQDEFFGSGLYTPTNEWSFVAVTVTSSNATLYVFNAEGTNSVVDESYLPTQPFDPDGSTNQVMAFNNPEYIGSDPNGAPLGQENFYGSIAAVAVFNQTLSSNQLQTLYSAALGTLPPMNIQISKVGTNVQINWPMGSLLQATSVKGPWTTNYLAAPPYTVAPTGTMFYRAVVP